MSTLPARPRAEFQVVPLLGSLEERLRVVFSPECRTEHKEHVSVFTIIFKCMLMLYATDSFLQVLPIDFLSTFGLQSVTGMQEW